MAAPYEEPCSSTGEAVGPARLAEDARSAGTFEWSNTAVCANAKASGVKANRERGNSNAVRVRPATISTSSRPMIALATAGCATAAGDGAANGAPPVAAARAPELHTSVYLDTYLQRAAPFGYSGAVLITRGGDTILKGAYGQADLQKGIPNTVETVFSLGSLAKQFTAAAIMKLEEQGKLSTSDPLARFFPDAPAETGAITIHQLLTHTSGLPTEVLSREVHSRDKFIDAALSAKLSSPGEFDYSNTGYSLLAVVVEEASGATYDSFLQEHLFAPAGMTKTGGSPARFSGSTIARGYYDGEDRGLPLDGETWGPDGLSWGFRGAGGILSTIGDMHRWYMALKGEEILSAASKAKMFSPHAERRTGYYGYGWFIDTDAAGRRRIHHSGSDGVRWAQFRTYPDEDLVFIMFSTRSNDIARKIEKRLLGAIFSDELPPVPPEAGASAASLSLSPHAGTYLFSSGARFEIKARESDVVLEPVDQLAMDQVLQLTSDEAALRRTRTDMASRVLTAVQRGELETLRDWFATAESYASVEEEFKHLLDWHGQRPSTVTVIGSGDAWWGERPSAVTFATATFPLQTNAIRFDWEGDKISGVSMQGNINPPRFVLQPSSGSELVGYDLRLEGGLKAVVEEGGRLRLQVGTLVQDGHRDRHSSSGS